MQQERKNIQEKIHTIVIENRKKINMLGVLDVYTFNEDCAVIETTKGTLTIKGKNFHLDKFNLETNDLYMTGDIDSIIYKNTFNTNSKKLLSWFYK